MTRVQVINFFKIFLEYLRNKLENKQRNLKVESCENWETFQGSSNSSHEKQFLKRHLLHREQPHLPDFVHFRKATYPRTEDRQPLL